MMTLEAINKWNYVLPFQKRVGYLGWLGHGNLGDEVLFSAVEDLLSPAMLLSYKLTDTLRTVEKWTHSQTYKAVILGGGTLINNGDSHFNFGEALDHGYKGCIFGTGVCDPEFWDHCSKPKNVLKEWHPLLKQSEYIGVRGPLSKQILEEEGFKDVEIVGDLVMSMAPDTLNTLFKKKTIAINIGISYGMVWGSESEILDTIVDLSNILLDQGWELTFLPVWREDVPYIEKALQRINRNVTLFDDYESVEAVFSFLKNCEIVIGEKLHSVIMAMTVNTPSIMLEYRPKCRDYMASMGMLNFNMRTDELNIDKILDLVNELHENNLRYRNEIYKRVQTFKHLQKDKAQSLRKLLAL